MMLVFTNYYLIVIMLKSLLIWLGTIAVFILILYSKTQDANWSNIELGQQDDEEN